MQRWYDVHEFLFCVVFGRVILFVWMVSGVRGNKRGDAKSGSRGFGALRRVNGIRAACNGIVLL